MTHYEYAIQMQLTADCWTTRKSYTTIDNETAATAACSEFERLKNRYPEAKFRIVRREISEWTLYLE